MRNPSRRSLLQILSAPLLLSAAAPRELACDVAIVGGSFGGVAAALGALRNGLRVVLTEESDWIGGQVTSQAVPPDEHQWIETHGATRLYRSYRDGVRDHYRRYYPLTDEARTRKNLNPGGGSVSRITHEPRVSLAVLEAMLAPHVSGGQLTVLLEHTPVAASTKGDVVDSVTVRDARGGSRRTITAKYFLDATEQGDLLQLTRTEIVTGFESRKDTGEMHAPEVAQPRNIQSFTVCFAMDYRAGEDHTISKPANYDFWRAYVPKMKPAWTGKLLDWTYSHPITLEPRHPAFHPEIAEPVKGAINLWIYRRIASKANFHPGAYQSDITLVNWPHNDYWLGDLHTGTPAEIARHHQGGRQLSMALFYWMQTACGFKGLRLRGDLTGSSDGLAKMPYIRESRRIRAEFTVTEQHVGVDARSAMTGKKPPELRAEKFADSVGVGSYRIDLHPSSGGDNYIDVASLPFQIPLGALIPKRVENLIPACKNLGVTHITNGCYRLHPVEWNIGESAGCLAAEAIRTGERPRQIWKDANRLKEFQSRMVAQGVELEWPAYAAARWSVGGLGMRSRR